MTLYMYDAAYSPNLAAVKAAGGIAINGYLTGGYSGTTTQPSAARAAGLGYVATYEEGASELVGASRATGQAVGQRILAAAKAKGIPLDGSIAVYPSVDVNAVAGSCDQAFLGIKDVINGKLSLRCYAEGAIIDHLAAAGITQGKGWLAAPTSWPGFNPNDPNVCMVQEVGTNVPGTDRNHLILDPHAIGAWWPDNSPYGDSNMALDPNDPVVKKILDALSGEIWTAAHHYNAAFAIQPLRAPLEFGQTLRWLGDNKGNVATEADVTGIVAKVSAVVQPNAPANAPVDVNALAQALVTELGPDLGKQFATAVAAHVSLTFKE